MGEFVCVRLIQANSLDLRTFQFDYDQSFAVFFLRDDRTIYGRYGTRSARPKDAAKDISIAGLAAALEAALVLHRDFPKNAEALAAKTGPAPRFAIPEKYPALSEFQAELNYAAEGQLARSCIHCHQIGDAERKLVRDEGRPIPERLLFPYPMPQVVGLELDPEKRATVARVADGSPAAKAGLRPGDELVSADGQPLVSIADFQWVLHQAGGEATIPLVVKRDGGEGSKITLRLPEGWRRGSGISWRVSTWDLRRMVLGGLVLEARDDDSGKLALEVKHVGQYGDHAVAKNAGFQEGDVVIEVDGRTAALTESELIASLLEATKPGDSVAMTVRREGRSVDLSLRMQ